jgi:carboxymethylenebutenolidase
MIRTEEIAQGRLDGHIAHAERPRGGVLILPTITAIDAHMRERARMLAEAGFTSMVWNPYPGEAPPADTASAMPRAAKLNDGRLEAMSDCVSHLLDQLRLPAVAVMGFCLGGRYAVLLAAKDKRLAGCVAYYPSVRVPMSPNQSLDAIALAADIQCPVQLIHGTADQVFLQPVFLNLREALDARTQGRHHGAGASRRGPQLRAAGPAFRAGQCRRHPVVVAAGGGVPGNLPAAGGMSGKFPA